MTRRAGSASPGTAQPSYVAFYEAHADSILRYCRVRISEPAEA